MSSNEHFITFAKPFIDALSDTFETMVQSKIKAHTPTIKEESTAKGDITSLIGMNGEVERDGKVNPIKGLLAISFPLPVYLKIASAMLMEEYTEFNEEIADTGSEIANIVMGNAKNGLNAQGYKIEMASPSTVRGPEHHITYPSGTTVIEVTVSSDHGDFSLELCYQET